MRSKGLVRWREWGEEAFAEAKAEGKLVLLDISAVWCHWCHVMDETSYSDPAAAGLINSRFIPVRVDTDRMPDVNERYNMGGWPTTAVLTPTGEVLVGATYVPPEKLIETLSQADEFYSANREAVEEKVRELVARIKAERAAASGAAPGEISAEAVGYVLGEIDKSLDPVHGGFGEAPKFPAPDALELMLVAHRDSGRPGSLEAAERTLAGMASHGMYDHEMGGFFRYSVTKDWAVPHYEKMLDVNAGLLRCYLDAYRLTGKGTYLDTAKKTIAYIDEWLWNKAGYFSGSQDADETYYALPLDERLLRDAPAVDRTMFTGLNARMAQSYLSAWEVTGGKKFMETALHSLGFILARMKGADGGLYHYHDGSPHRPGLLTDHSATLGALTHACQLTGEGRWLDEALGLAGFMDRTFWDGDKGGYFDLPRDPGAIAALSARRKPLIENSEAARALMALSSLTGDEGYREKARLCLVQFAHEYEDYGYMAASYALALDLYLKRPTEITIVGEAGSAGRAALVTAAGCAFVPRRVLRLLDYRRDKAELEQRGLRTEGPASAYICRGSACSAPVDDPERLSEELKKPA